MIPYGGLPNCDMLERVTLPTSLYMVGDKAFYGCAKISDIYCKGADPAVAYDGSFDGMRVSSCKLHIPYNTVELYKRSTGWKNFYFFEEEAPLHVQVVLTTGPGVEVARYDAAGRRIQRPVPGVNIVRYSDGTTRKVLVK